MERRLADDRTFVIALVMLIIALLLLSGWRVLSDQDGTHEPAPAPASSAWVPLSGLS